MTIDAVIVLYNPDENQVLRNIEIISLKVRQCYVIVNSCNDDIIKKILGYDKCVVINNNANIGLSKSLNIGLKQVIKNDANAVILFDQDSMPEDTFFCRMLESYHNLIHLGEKVGAIGSNSYDTKNIDYSKKDLSPIKEVSFVITSGCLIPIKTLKEVGLMDETFFIDYIDYEWCFRALSKNYKIFVSTSAILHHNLGDKLVGVLNIKKPIHNNVMRHYHIIKNQLIIVCRDYIPLQWRIKHFFKIFYRIPGYIIYSVNSRQSAKNIYKAVKDFIKMKNKNKYLY